MASVTFTLRNGLPTTPITVNGKVITNPTDVANLIAAEKQAIAVRDAFKGKPGFTTEYLAATRAASAAVDSAAQVALNNVNAAATPPASSGAQTLNAQQARDDRANPQSPPGPPLTAGPNGRVAPASAPQPTNARPPNTNTANA